MADDSLVDSHAGLRITEIFYSLQGETRTVGLPTVFVRLTGCPLRCGYCDTVYAFTGGTRMNFSDILDKVGEFEPKYVTVTGGEPLAQPACLPLLNHLCDQNYQVSLETSGALDISKVDSRVAIVLDLKTPASGEENQNLYENIEYLRSKDTVKFVLCDRSDYEWSRNKLNQFNIGQTCEVLFSPVNPGLNATALAQWILDDRLPVRLQLQVHKLLWGNVPGR
ncbi:7-carboxy-7-deazaguanine synthase QueE [Pseudomonadota bacterium]